MTRQEQPAHQIFLLPTVKLDNRLPIDIEYNLSGEKGLIKAGTSAAVTSVSYLVRDMFPDFKFQCFR